MSILNFINTLIFALISSTISVVILLLMFVDSMSEYFPLLIVIEIGLISIIIWSLASIVNYDVQVKGKIEATKEERFNLKKTGMCPDYFKIQTLNENSVRCLGTVELQDSHTGVVRKYELSPGSLDVKTMDEQTQGKFCQDNFKNDQSFAWTEMKSLCDTLNSI